MVRLGASVFQPAQPFIFNLLIGKPEIQKCYVRIGEIAVMSFPVCAHSV